MGDKSKIEWTDATWNPSTGCSKVSSGCKHCYAEVVAQSMVQKGVSKYKNGFKYTEHEKNIEDPVKWKTPKRIFVNSMSDVFHEDATKPFLDRIFEVMEDKAPWHIYQILTKRPQRMAEYTKDRYGNKPPRNIWFGTSVESRDVLYRIGELQYVPAAVRFISFEPLLGPIPDTIELDGIHWAIIGGESGRYYRKCDPDWIRWLIRVCKERGLAVFFKQYGGLHSGGNRVLDGRTWDEYPEVPDLTIPEEQMTLV